MAVRVQTMWWCRPCSRRIARPLWKNPGQSNQWAYHLAGGGWGHSLESAPMIEGELVPDHADAGIR
ncbi:hypothetical protein [Actinoplanes sp. NPDC049118]|uniref:hypothetical protein n=1 Tax=Actinoplanes sp. NPDC049118 TaxID=3155769 RepID=UPI0033DB0461